MATPSDRQALLALPLVHGEISATRRRAANARSRRISVPGGRSLVATPVFDTYWRFAYERQEVFHRRAAGDAPPWTHDQIIAAHRFTNVYRASDRVSQYLIRHVIYTGEQSVEEVFFRTILFKLFNRVGTWERLAGAVGPLSWRSFRVARLEAALDAMMGSGESVYSGAYIMPSPSFGAVRKHSNHLKLLEHMMKDGAPRKVATARSLSEVFSVLRSYRSLGDFLAFQLTIDLNYGPSIDFSEMDFVVAGPGARDGIRKCFAECGGLDDADLIRAVTDLAVPEFERLGLPFRDLWGRRPQLIDLQNVFCEVDKYARVAHPEFTGHSGRTRIKQKFVAADRPTPQWYPPKWKLDTTGAPTIVTSERYALAPAVHRKGTPLTS
jgi:hypothetical protein